MGQRISNEESVLHGITELFPTIDKECCSLLNGHECGLINIKTQFHDRVTQETGRQKISEELILAWRLKTLLEQKRGAIRWEHRYPAQRKRCDLVIPCSPQHSLWVELKFAWKAWFECFNGPVHSNPLYFPYLTGKGKSHSLRHDFDKLMAAPVPAADCKAVCLVGFDREDAPMHPDVAAVVEQVRRQAPWKQTTELSWRDRRCPEFRINVFTWLLSPNLNSDRDHGF